MKKILVLCALVFVFSFNLFAQNSSPKQINAGVVNGKAVSLPKPAYPAAAKAVKAGGAVNVQVVIDEQGNVVSATAVSGHPLLQSAAVSAAQQAKFQPTTLSGQPVKVSGVIVYNFVPSTDETGYKERLKIMGVGAFIKLAEVMPGEEWENTSAAMSADEEFGDALAPLASIKKETPGEVRVETLRKVSAALDAKFKGDDAWQFAFGKAFGEFMTLLLKLETENKLDETAVKTSLAKIKDLSATAPKDFPSELLGKFKTLGELSAADLKTEDNLLQMLNSMMDILETISPEEK